MKIKKQRSNKEVVIATIFFIGILEFVSILFINPWIGQFWRNEFQNYSDVLSSYFWIVLSISIITVSLCFIVKKLQSDLIINILILFATLSIIILVDRILLVKFGLPLWTFDTEIHYKHRPFVTRNWGEQYSNKPIKINSYGFHDDEFPIKKKEKEFRAIAFGNSITMGHGLTYNESFPNILEKLLNKEKSKYESFQIINAGVQGYATFQELVTLKRSVTFQPDLIILGFCLNDITEPFRVNKLLGGSGIDYHKILQSADWFTAYLSNETGFGRLIQFLFYTNKLNGFKEQELKDIRALCSNNTDKIFYKNWKKTLNDLQEFYKYSQKKGIPIILVIFPFTFQLFSKEYQKPQLILKNHAESNNVKVIDLTKIIENILLQFHKDASKNISRYFLDEDHYTYEGNKIIANELFYFINDSLLTLK